MKLAYRINFILLLLNSFLTSICKLAQLDFEMELFRQGGFPDSATLVLGALQLLGALLLCLPKTRRYGGGLMALTFLVGSGVVFAAGKTPFGIFSLLFIAMALWPVARPNKWSAYEC